MLAIQDIKDKVFWKGIYILLSAVFPALEAIFYCDSNVPVMDKIFHLVKRAEDAILKSTKELDDEAIFGPSCSATATHCEDEFNEICGEDDESSDDDKYVKQNKIFFFKSVLNIFPVFQMLKVTLRKRP